MASELILKSTSDVTGSVQSKCIFSSGETNAISVPKDNSFSPLSHRSVLDTKKRGVDAVVDSQLQISWTDFLRRPEMAICIRSEGWIDQLRTLLRFSLRNDDTAQLGYVLVMAGPSGLTLRDLIQSPAEQTHAIQLMFGGNRAPSPRLDNGTHYESMIHDLNDDSVEQNCGPLPTCLTWIWVLVIAQVY